MKLFYISSMEKIALDFSSISHFKLGKVNLKRYSDGDVYVEIKEKIKSEKCLILGGTNNEQLLETIFLAHTLKKEGAGEITALIPYLAYSRQDRDLKGKSFGVKIIGEMLKASGIKRVIVIDIHSEDCKKNFPIPLISINPYNSFIKKLNIKKITDISLVVPDKGAKDNAEFFNKQLNKNLLLPIFYIEKIRIGKRIQILKSEGTVLKDAIIIDDILDSGQTIINAVREIKKHGAINITIIVTHALFTGFKWKELWNFGVNKIYCTDSVGKKVIDKRIKYIKSAEIFSKYFK